MRQSRETVVIGRPVRVQRVPGGDSMALQAGTAAQITQALGASFTLLVDGQLVRLAGLDADAIGRAVPCPAPQADAELGPEQVEELVWETLKTCYDPEIPVDIVELGLIYVCDILPIDEGMLRVSVKMTLTAPGCGMGEILANEVHDKLSMLPHVAEVDVEMVFDPPWDRSMMSEAAALTLGL